MTYAQLCPLSFISSIIFFTFESILRASCIQRYNISALVPIQNLAMELYVHADKYYECYLIIYTQIHCTIISNAVLREIKNQPRRNKDLVAFSRIYYIGISFITSLRYNELIFPVPCTSLNRGSTVLVKRNNIENKRSDSGSQRHP